MKLGSVPYLNALPLIAGLVYPLETQIPRQLLATLKQGQLDIALLSTVTLFENSDFYLIPGMGIGCKGPIQSVKLFFNKPGLTFQNITSFKPSPESNTANILARILLKGAAVLGDDAEVVIGDAAMTRPDPYGSVDLGELWMQRTGLPFVFAAWISRHPQISKSLWQELIDTKTRNLAQLDACIAASPLVPELSLEAKRDYLRNNIHFELGDDEFAGLQKFRDECIRTGLLSHACPIQCVEMV
jgi:chorismate dehydratase